MEIEHDKPDQLQKIMQLIMPGETLYAVLDCKGGGTGFVGITDLRLIFMDQAFISKSRAVVSLPYSRITAVGSVDSGKGIMSMLSSTAAALFSTSILQIIAGSREWSFEFRTNEKAHRAYELIMRNLLQGERKGIL
ncbi:MAG: hypothetical protein KJ063_02600 [Anaerolineae bacterium]|nr:hypothetical protein [Anaerolineae bacterium]